MSYSTTLHYQYPDRRSREVKYWAPPSWSTRSSLLGSGYRSFIVKLFKALKSIQNRRVPSGFFTNRTGEPHGELDGLMAPDSNNSSICSFISSCSAGECLYIGRWTGLAPGCKGILEVSPNPRSGGVFDGRVAGNKSLNFLSKSLNLGWMLVLAANKYGTAPSGSSGSWCRRSWRYARGLLALVISARRSLQSYNTAPFLNTNLLAMQLTGNRLFTSYKRFFCCNTNVLAKNNVLVKFTIFLSWPNPHN